jgi:hypothetical protein
MRGRAQLIFFLQHPIIELVRDRAAQHLVHPLSAGLNHHYIYPAT